jgi:hypothetical protein
MEAELPILPEVDTVDTLHACIDNVCVDMSSRKLKRVREALLKSLAESDSESDSD